MLDPSLIAERFAQVQERVAAACIRVGRQPEEVTVVGVTKTHPVELVQAAMEAGIREFGENKVQELAEKSGAVPGEQAGGLVRWHLIGHLQRNKAKAALAHADLFHALDSPRLAEELEKRAAQAGRVLPCLVQVNVSEEESKFGQAVEDVLAFARKLVRYEHLQIRGLMTIAAYKEDPEQVRPQFRQLRDLRDRLAALDLPGMAWQQLSMGMSSDYEVAIEEGATIVRIGSALFGPRG